MDETVYISGDPAQAASWSNGLPVGKTAVLNASSAGCSLTSAIAWGGLSITADYGGTFSQAGFGMTIGDGGVGKFWIMKASTINGTVDFYGDDVAINAAIGSTGTLNVYTNATYRQGNASTWRVVVDDGATLTQPFSQHPNLGFTTYSVMYGSGIINNGTVESEIGYTCAAFANNGTFRATSSSERYVAASQISMASGATVSGNIAIRGLSSRKPTLAPGDYRGFTRIYSNVSDNATFTFSDGEFDLPEFQPGGPVVAPSGVTLRCYADVLFAAVPTSFFAKIIPAGTADQDIDLMTTNALAMEIQKTAGNLTLRNVYDLAADSEINGVLTNNGTLDVPDGLLLKVNKYIDTSTGTLSGGGTLKTKSIVPA